MAGTLRKFKLESKTSEHTPKIAVFFRLKLLKNYEIKAQFGKGES